LKILAIIQARTGSKRLPNKALLKILGKPILGHIVDFLKFSKLIDQIVIATTNLAEDDIIENFSNQLGIACFRGDAEDVLDRYYQCAKFYKGDLIVRITSDDPLIDPNIIDKIIETCTKTKKDYVSNVINPSFPLGFSSCEVFSFSILEKLHQKQKDSLTREHVTFHIRQKPHLYKIVNIKAPKNLERPSWRLTIDYPEDLHLISIIFENLYSKNSFIKYENLVKFLDKNKDLLKINTINH